jgi:hypothetical protein
MAAEIILWIVAALLVLGGVAGLVLPALPGAPILFGGLFCAAWAEGFEYVSTGTLVALGVIAVLTYLVDFAAGAFGAKKFGASRRSVIGAIIGSIVGLFFGIPGLLIGPFVGAVAGELTVRADLKAAGRAGIGATIGLAIGTAAKLSLGFTMIALYIFMRILNG